MPQSQDPILFCSTPDLTCHFIGWSVIIVQEERMCHSEDSLPGTRVTAATVSGIWPLNLDQSPPPLGKALPAMNGEGLCLPTVWCRPVSSGSLLETLALHTESEALEKAVAMFNKPSGNFWCALYEKPLAVLEHLWGPGGPLQLLCLVNNYGL